MRVEYFFCPKCRGNVSCTGLDDPVYGDEDTIETAESYVCNDCGHSFKVEAVYRLEFFRFVDEEGYGEDDWINMGDRI